MKAGILTGILLPFLGLFLIVGFRSVPGPGNNIQKSPGENFQLYCAGCHGTNMERFAGKTYQAGVSDSYLENTVKEGLPTMGMPAFRKTFSDDEVRLLVDYMVDELRQEKNDQAATVFPPVISSMYGGYSLEPVITGLDVPWTVAFLPDGDMLVAERSGQLFRFRNDKLAAIIEGVPPVFARGQGGLFDIVLHPDYRLNGWIYISYAAVDPDDGDKGNTAVIRARLRDDKLTDIQNIFAALPYSDKTYHFGGRMVFDRSKHLYVTVGDRGNRPDAQSLDTYSGKVHRLNDDGTIPADNPFTDKAGAITSTYSYGHRNQQGIVYNLERDEIWTNEHGPKGGDELNLIVPGKNYGWPEITYGINYDGTIITPLKEKEGMEQPVHQWTPSIAPSSLLLVTSDRYPQWKGDFFSGSLSFRYLERTRVQKGSPAETEKLLDGIGRVRHVCTGPDGYIYVAVEKPGAVYRLLPATGPNKQDQ